MAGFLRGRRVLLLILLLAAAGGGMLLSLFLRPMVVVSGSMEPAIPTGSLTLVRVQRGRSCAVGEIIVFRPPGREHLVVHRVVALRSGPEGEAYLTRGDNNPVPDRDVVSREAVVGRVAAIIPWAGPVAELLRTSPVSFAFLGVACVPLNLGTVLIFTFLRRRRRVDSPSHQ